MIRGKQRRRVEEIACMLSLNRQIASMDQRCGRYRQPAGIPAGQDEFFLTGLV